MPFILQYILKLSLSLGVVFLFYQLVLRKLTFYNWNRWYLVGYTLLCFFIPFINVSPVLERNEWTGSNAVTWVPVIGEYESNAINTTPVLNHYTPWNIISMTLLAGMFVMLFRLVFQLISFRRMIKKAKAIPGEGINLFQVDEEIIPFSFGNSIFINRHLHAAGELQEIIRHEFVHVKQKHSIDIVWGEILCIINWYNPFAWLLKKCIRQNLEFIADDQVLENGINKKQYQYLLLKVIGNNQFSIAPKFNFSSLKKRIAMMNKSRTARLHLVRFLFILPLLAIVLLSFRKQISDTLSPRNNNKEITVHSPFNTDTLPGIVQLNDKGYYFDVREKSNKDGIVVVKDRNGKEVERISLTKWKENQKHYEDTYGELLPPPPPPPSPPVPPTPPIDIDDPGVKTFLKRNPDVKKIGWDFINESGKLALQFIVTKKDGTTEKFNLNDVADKSKAEKRYGELPLPPPPPVPPTKEVSVVQGINGNTTGDDFEITVTDKKAVVHLKNGKDEVYDLTNAARQKEFEDKYGIINVNTKGTIIAPVARVTTTLSGTAIVAAPVKTSGSSLTSVSAIPRTVYGTAIVSPIPALTTVNEYGAVTISGDSFITGEEEAVITITPKTTPGQLEEYKKQMKEKGIELKFDDTRYDKGILTHISGTVKFKDGSGSFSGSDFRKLILAIYKDGDNIYFKVRTTDKSEVI